jgi:hypothetical protein
MTTLGGLPESEALHWNEETYQRAGEIIKNLASGNPERRKKGYIDFHEMRRHFMDAEWTEKITQLDFFRVANRHPKIADVIERIRQELIATGHVDAAVEIASDIPPFEQAMKELDLIVPPGSVPAGNELPVDTQLGLF